MDEILRQIGELQEYGAPRWWIQNWFAQTHPQHLNNPNYLNAITQTRYAEDPSFDTANPTGPNDFSKPYTPKDDGEMTVLEDAQPADRDLVNVDGYLVDRNGVYRSSDGTKAYQLGDPYGRKALEYEQSLTRPGSYEGQMQSAARFGESATPQEQRRAVDFMNRVNEAFKQKDALSGTKQIPSSVMKPVSEGMGDMAKQVGATITTKKLKRVMRIDPAPSEWRR